MSNHGRRRRAVGRRPRTAGRGQSGHPYVEHLDPDDREAFGEAALARARGRGCRCPAPTMLHFDYGGSPPFIRTHVLHDDECPLGAGVPVADLTQIVRSEVDSEDAQRRCLEDAADVALAAGRHVVVDGYVVIPDAQMRELVTAHGDEGRAVEASAWQLRRESDGRVTYVFRAPPEWLS